MSGFFLDLFLKSCMLNIIYYVHRTRYIGFIIKLRQEASGFNVVGMLIRISRLPLLDWKHFCQYVVIGDTLFEIIFFWKKKKSLIRKRKNGSAFTWICFCEGTLYQSEKRYVHSVSVTICILTNIFSRKFNKFSIT